MVRCRNAPELTYQTLQAEGQAQLGISRSGSVGADLAGCRPQGAAVGCGRLPRPRRPGCRADLAAVGQDIAALTLAGDLRDLRLAQRSCAYSPRLPEVAAAAEPACDSWPLG